LIRPTAEGGELAVDLDSDGSQDVIGCQVVPFSDGLNKKDGPSRQRRSYSATISTRKQFEPRLRLNAEDL